MTTIATIYARAKDTHSRCVKRTLRIDEVKYIVASMWEELYSVYEKDSGEWRIVDKARKEHTDWWSVPTMSDYAKDQEAHNVICIIDVIEGITGKRSFLTPPSNQRNKQNNMLSWLAAVVVKCFSNPTNLSPLKLLGAIGSVASIIALILVF